ncbi:hypothetical protein DH2020_006195 [Rehmannia glutinosa]|uniref:Molybdopterin cofactor biosynthesis C (MoaC) domain-containing protein n=1 Tax=Rehmannia glutinosa TaxID=99300 RepID=A0ABR0XIS5_REHGL
MMFLRRVTSKLKPMPRSRLFSSDSGHDLSKVIAELNQEMEFVSGEPLALGPAGSTNNQTMAQESHLIINDITKKETFSSLTHIGSKGEAQMVDISSKEITKRVVVASCKVIVEIKGQVVLIGKTGVEMEALTAVTIDGLTFYDMCKAASKDILIMDIRLEHKSGGKSGEWSRKV